MNWWKNGNLNIPYNNKNFLKIIDFYLFNCPVYTIKGSNNHKVINNVSKHNKSFYDLNYKQQDFKKLLNKIRKPIKSYMEYYFLENDKNLESEFNIIVNNIKLKDPEYDFIIYKSLIPNNKTMSIFYAIRNAFAHGTFSIKTINQRKKIYYFESKNNNIIKARIRLKEKTLLNWIDFVNEINRTK